jgi:hypothetical protein
MASRRRSAPSLPALALLALLVLLVSACAPGPNTAAGTPPAGGEPLAGFWLGLWHGLIGPVTLVISLFTDSVNLYEVHNDGNWYDVGFFLGLGVLVGGSHGSR